MENELLDKILAELSDSSDITLAEDLIEKFNLGGGEWNCPEFKFLESKKYLRIDREGAVSKTQNHFSSKAALKITALGLHFIKNGGFINESKYKDETLQVAKDSKYYAKWAFIISIIGIAITILLFVLDKLEVFTPPTKTK